VNPKYVIKVPDPDLDLNLEGLDPDQTNKNDEQFKIFLDGRKKYQKNFRARTNE